LAAVLTARKSPPDKAGVAVTDRGFINVDKQMRTNVQHIFAIGDLVGQPMLAHKAVHEAHVAAEAAAGEKAYFDAQVIPSVAYTDPEVAWVGVTEDEAKAKGIKVEKGLFPWLASAVLWRMAATKVSPNCCLMQTPNASLAAVLSDACR
jgi:dihydrolipoamide dehydrogenase